MSVVANGITIEHHLDVLYDWIADLSNHAKFAGAVDSIELVEGTAGRPRSRYRGTSRFLGLRRQLTVRTIVVDKPDLLEFDAPYYLGLTSGRVRWTFVPIGRTGTWVGVWAEFDSPSSVIVVRQALEFWAKQATRRLLVECKRVAEDPQMGPGVGSTGAPS